MECPVIINGGSFSDRRGTIDFVNDFHFEGIKRFYVIENTDVEIVRAWQGHKLETKCFYAIQGSYLIAWVKIDNWDQPSVDLKPETIILSANDPKILIIPLGFANGLKALETGSRIMVMSDFLLEDSLKDKIRFDQNLWMNW